MIQWVPGIASGSSFIQTPPSRHDIASIFSCDLKKLRIIHPLLIIQSSEVPFPINFLFYKALKVGVKEIHFGTPM